MCPIYIHLAFQQLSQRRSGGQSVPIGVTLRSRYSSAARVKGHSQTSWGTKHSNQNEKLSFGIWMRLPCRLGSQSSLTWLNSSRQACTDPLFSSFHGIIHSACTVSSSRPLTTIARKASSTCNAQKLRHASTASSNRWKNRQANDAFAREARVAGLKSRAAFKLLQVLHGPRCISMLRR